MNGFVKRFEAKTGKKVSEVFKRGKVLLVSLEANPDEMDAFYITSEDLKEINHFSPIMSLELFDQFMKNKVYG